jgi:hypothetical protein
MLEIIALVFLTKNMGNLASQKGLKPGPWKLYTVLAWIVAEVFGVILGSILFQNIAASMLIGIGLAVASYFTVKTILSNKPDAMDIEIDQIGQPTS